MIFESVADLVWESVKTWTKLFTKYRSILGDFAGQRNPKRSRRLDRFRSVDSLLPQSVLFCPFSSE
jgi:hypothetical protein